MEFFTYELWLAEICFGSLDGENGENLYKCCWDVLLILWAVFSVNCQGTVFLSEPAKLTLSAVTFFFSFSLPIQISKIVELCVCFCEAF